MKIYVGNLAPETTEADLQRMFGCFGRVTSAVLTRDEPSGQSKGCGYIDMPVDAEAWNAIRWLDGQGLQVQGWIITLETELEDAGQAELNLDKARFKARHSD
jgi:RNA recognition motif-containing protein